MEKKIINKQRTDYLSKDEYFMASAKLSSMRSKDPNTQVGACIVSKDNRILSSGYNGAPNGFEDKYADLDSTIASKRMLDECGVKYRQLSKEHQKTITLDLNNK